MGLLRTTEPQRGSPEITNRAPETVVQMDPKILRASEVFRLHSNTEPRVPQSFTCKPMVGCFGSPTDGAGGAGFLCPVLGSASPGLNQQVLTQQNGVGGGAGSPSCLVQSQKGL